MVSSCRVPAQWPLLLAAGMLAASGCRMAPREQLDDCHRLSQTLRSENARLKDEALALRSDNQDKSERAVDDARRIAQLETVNQRLETSVQAYQDERSRLESAYKELQASLPSTLKPLSLNTRQEYEDDEEEPAEPIVNRAGHPSRAADRDARQAEAQAEDKEDVQERPDRTSGSSRWVPSRAEANRGRTRSAGQAADDREP